MKMLFGPALSRCSKVDDDSNLDGNRFAVT